MKRRGKKRAIIAIARMILTSIYAMISTGEVFSPSDLQRFDMPEELQKKRTIAEAKGAVKLHTGFPVSLNSDTPFAGRP